MNTLARSRTLFTECVTIVARHKYAWAATIVLPLLLAQFVSISVNVTESLPQRFFIILKGASVDRGDYAAFRWHGGGPYREGVTFVKIVAGVGGDNVEAANREYRVNGGLVGKAKTHARTGSPLDLGPTGIIPPGSYYMMATHKDSLDSRYALTGWIREEELIGRAYAIF